MRRLESSSLALAMGLLALLIGACSHPGYASFTDAEKRTMIERMYEEYKEKFPGVPDIAPKEAEVALEADQIVLVDVREPREQAVSMIAGAITREQFEQARDQYRDTRIVTYCTIGYRSGEYAATLMDEGYDVANLRGSILAWAHEGLPLVGPDHKPTLRAHVFGKRWDLLPSGYQSKY